jgi:tetratricopeptide (TPR) repeat protein
MKKASSGSKTATKPKDGSSAAAARSAKAPGGGTAEKPAADGGGAARAQSAWFDKAAAAFHERDFQAALRNFEKAVSGPQLEVTHAARSYIRMCEQRIKTSAQAPVSAEDHYNYAIALINQRSFVEAEKHLQQALGMAPGSDHLHYALALCLGMQGKLIEAHTNLKRAIEIDPRNRAQARMDPDFAELVRQPLIEELLYPGRSR